MSRADKKKSQVYALKTWKDEPKAFKSDYRTENPTLHILYVKMALKNLAIIDRQIQELLNLSNGSVMEMIYAMQNQREKLVKENAAYFDAAHMLEILRGTAEPSGISTEPRCDEEDENPEWGLCSQ